MCTIAISLCIKKKKRLKKIVQGNNKKNSCYTCKTAKIITKIVTTSKQAATARAVIVVNGETTCENIPLLSAEPPPIPSPKSSPNSAPIAIRRLPAGDEFMQPPNKEIQKKID